MNEIAKAIMSLGETKSRLDKEAKLKKYANLVGFKEVLQFIFNPYTRTCIGTTKLKKNKVAMKHSPTWYQAIEYFTQHQTGSDTDVAYALGFIDDQETNDAYALAEAIVTKTLKVGVTETTLNKIYGDSFIPVLGVMLSEKYEEQKTKVKGPFIATEKLDGQRRIIVKENGVVTMYTRSGLPDEGLVDIEKEAALLPDNYMYDGELLAIGEFKDGVALRQATNSIASSEGIRTGVTFNMFDMVPVSEFKTGVSKLPAIERKKELATMFRQFQPGTLQFIVKVPVLGIVTTEEEIVALAQPIWERGFEGLMLHTLTGLYEVKRSKQLLKVKNVYEDVFRVIDVYEGKGEFVGTLGGVVFEYKGYKVEAGSGFNKDQRAKYWANPQLIIGKSVEINHFGESSNAQGGLSLNCPIFKRLASDV